MDCFPLSCTIMDSILLDRSSILRDNALLDKGRPTMPIFLAFFPNMH